MLITTVDFHFSFFWLSFSADDKSNLVGSIWLANRKISCNHWLIKETWISLSLSLHKYYEKQSIKVQKSNYQKLLPEHVSVYVPANCWNCNEKIGKCLLCHWEQLYCKDNQPKFWNHSSFSRHPKAIYVLLAD